MPPRHAPNAVPTPADGIPFERVMVGDRLYPTDAPTLRADDRGFLYGDGVFETIRVVGGRPCHLDLHLDRLSAALRALAIRPPTDPPLGIRLATLLTANGLDRADAGECAVRITVSRGPGTGPRPTTGPPTVVLTARSLGHGFRRRREGVALRTVRGLHRVLPRLKSLCYLPAVLALAAVADDEEPLFVDDARRVLEGATCNVFARFGDRLVTPPEADVLPGVARGLLLQRASALGLSCTPEPLPLDRMLAADGLWVSNALLPLAPVSAVDGVLRATDPMTRRLRGLLDPGPIGTHR